MTDQELRAAAHKAMDAYLDAGGSAEFVIISQKDVAGNTPTGINEEHATNLIEIGVDLGVFTVANIFLEGGSIDMKSMQHLADMCSKHIEEVTGMPAEDFALKVKPVVDAVLKAAKEQP